MNEDDIVVTHAEGAGCYGHNGADDVALDAALLARAANGRPVRLQWMREDEFAWEPYGAAMAIELEARLDARGQHRFLAPRALEQRPHPPPGPRRRCRRWSPRRTSPSRSSSRPRWTRRCPRAARTATAIPLYDFPDLLVVNNYVREMPLRSSSLRSLGAYANVFAIESFMDELRRRGRRRSGGIPPAAS